MEENDDLPVPIDDAINSSMIRPIASPSTARVAARQLSDRQSGFAGRTALSGGTGGGDERKFVNMTLLRQLLARLAAAAERKEVKPPTRIVLDPAPGELPYKVSCLILSDGF